MIDQQESEREKEDQAQASASASSAATIYVSEFPTKAEDRVCTEVISSFSNSVINALIDTGSYVNLIRELMFKKLYGLKALNTVNRNEKIQAVNDSLIKVHGKSYDKIKLKGLENWFDLDFLVVDDRTMKYDLLLG